MSSGDFKQKQVLVTGAASGIGYETAMAFAERGASLVITDINGEALEEVRQEIVAKGVGCLARVVDVADEAAMRRFADDVHASVSAIDVLVNNAGIGYVGPFLGSPLESWRRVLDINVMGVVHGCYFFVPKMVAAGGPRRVVNIASLAGIAPPPGLSAYAASKFAVMGLSDVLAMELHDTAVGVTTVCPGVIDTPITAVPNNVSPAVSSAQIDRLRGHYRTIGIPPKAVADAIVDGVIAGKGLVLVGPYARPMYHLKRISRSFVRRLTLADARKNGYF